MVDALHFAFKECYVVSQTVPTTIDRLCEPTSPLLVDLDLFCIVYLWLLLSLSLFLLFFFLPEIVHIFFNSGITNNSYGSHLMLAKEPLGL